MTLAVLKGRQLKLRMKPPHDIADIRETALRGNRGNGQFTVEQQEPRTLHPALRDILHRAEADCPAEMRRKAAGGYMISVGQFLQGKRFTEGVVKIVQDILNGEEGELVGRDKQIGSHGMDIRQNQRHQRFHTGI